MKLKEKKFQVLAWGLCIVLAVGLIYMVRIDKKQKAERNLQLQQQVQEPEKDYEEITERQTEIYDNLCADLNIPDFVFWGDNLMTAITGDSLTSSLNSTIDKNLFKNLTNTFHTVLEDDEYVIPSVSITNMGVENEDVRHILVRAGVTSLYLSEDLNLSSSKEPVPIYFTDEGDQDEEESDNNNSNDRNSDADKDEAELLFADQSFDLFGSISISGIQGSLQKTDEWIDPIHPRYAFLRDQEGDSQLFEAGTQVNIETASKYVGDIPIFYFENITDQDVDGFMHDLEKLVERYADLKEDIVGNEEIEGEDGQEVLSDDTYDLPFVVICKTSENSNLDNIMKTEYGSHYVRADRLSSEMNESSLRILSQSVYNSLDGQGCFTDIKTKIRTAIEEFNNL